MCKRHEPPAPGFHWTFSETIPKTDGDLDCNGEADLKSFPEGLLKGHHNLFCLLGSGLSWSFSERLSNIIWPQLTLYCCFLLQYHLLALVLLLT